MNDAGTGTVEAGQASCDDPQADSSPARWLVIANPAAGRAGWDGRAWRRLERVLRQAQLSFDVEWTLAAGDGARIAAAAWRDGREHFLVAGGDGSLHDVINGLQRQRRIEAGPRIPVVVPLPLGTGNDWARSIQLPRQPSALAALLCAGRSVSHDLGRIDFIDPAGGILDTRWFINVAGAGFDAHVIERLPQRTPSRFAYLGGALRELARYRPPTFSLTLDDATTVRQPCLLVFVANGQYCGGGMHIAPTSRIDDGALDVVSIGAVGLLRALPKLARLYLGSLLHDPLVKHRLATRLRIDAEPATGIEADGQYVGRTPAIITVEPGALRTLQGLPQD